MQNLFHLFQSCFSTNGYADSFWYSIGKDIGDNFIGWNGIGSTTNASTVIEDILTVKNDSKKPHVKLKFKSSQNGFVFFQKELTEFTNPRYPIGRCHKVNNSSKSSSE